MADEPKIDDTPKPTPARGQVVTPMWMGKYPIVRPEHEAELEREAAVREFGQKVPRERAEAEAHADYVRQRRVEASAHHLAGMKAASAAGDSEAARKHSLMYELHSKALGHEPVGPAHPAVAAHLKDNPAKVYRFKPHHGDVFAIQGRGGEEETGPKLDKAEVLHALHGVLSEVLKKGDVVEFPKKNPHVSPYTHRIWPHYQQAGYTLDVRHDPEAKRLHADLRFKGAHAGTVSAAYQHPGRVGPVEGVPGDELSQDHPLYEIMGHALRHRANDLQYEVGPRVGLEQALGRLVELDQKERGDPQKKAELSPRARSTPCVCPSYKFPHRHGGGKCRGFR